MMTAAKLWRSRMRVDQSARRARAPRVVTRATKMGDENLEPVGAPPVGIIYLHATPKSRYS